MFETASVPLRRAPQANASSPGTHSLSKLVFIHIGKTGGTSLRHSLAAAGFNCSNEFEQSHMTATEAAHYEQFGVICGHISRADQLKWFPDRSVITILRSPIDRCLSFIRYVKNLERNEHASPFVKQAARMPDIELIETIGGLQNTSNTMVRQLGGHMLDLAPESDLPELLERAKQTIREAAWFGFTETMPIDIARLAKKVGAHLHEVRDNVTEGRPPRAAEAPGLINYLATINQYDLKLYRWAQEQKR